MSETKLDDTSTAAPTASVDEELAELIKFAEPVTFEAEVEFDKSGDSTVRVFFRGSASSGERLTAVLLTTVKSIHAGVLVGKRQVLGNIAEQAAERIKNAEPQN